MTVKELRQMLDTYDGDMQIDLFNGTDDQWSYVEALCRTHLYVIDGRLVLSCRRWPSDTVWLDTELQCYRDERDDYPDYLLEPSACEP